MPPRRTSLQVDVSRVLYAVYICQYVCRVVDRVWIHVQVGQGMPHQQAQYLASSIRFPDKNNVESKVFWASLGTGPMQKQKKTAVIAKNKPLELPRSGTNAVFRVKLDIYHPYCALDLT